MKWCTRIRITGMLPNGMVTGVKLRDISQVDNAHDFGLHQIAVFACSLVTGNQITVYHPELHFEGLSAETLVPGGTDA